MTFIISNLVSLNGGDAAIAFGMMKAIGAAFGTDTTFVLGDSNPRVAGMLYPENRFTQTLGIQASAGKRVRFIGRYLLKKRFIRYKMAVSLPESKKWLLKLLVGKEAAQTIQIYRDCAAVISCGGTYLRQDYGVISQLVDYRLALKMGKPLVFYTQSIGSFSDPKTRRDLQEVFTAANAIFVRDEESVRNLENIGVDPAKIQMRPDAAFALASPDVLQAAKSRKLPTDRPLKVAVSVRKWKHFANKSSEQGNDEYADAIAGAVTWLVGKLGAEVTFISTCQGVEEYDDDSIFANKIADKLGAKTKENVVVTSQRMDHTRIMQELAAHDITLGTRMHMCILSLISGTPVLPIAYEFKTKELFTRLGFDENVLDMEQIDSAKIIDKMHNILGKLDTSRSSLFTAVEREYRDAMHTGVLLANILKGEQYS